MRAAVVADEALAGAVQAGERRRASRGGRRWLGQSAGVGLADGVALSLVAVDSSAEVECAPVEPLMQGQWSNDMRDMLAGTYQSSISNESEM